MKSDNHNVDYRSNASLLKEADALSRRQNCPGDFALYVMYLQALTAGDNSRAPDLYEPTREKIHECIRFKGLDDIQKFLHNYKKGLERQTFEDSANRVTQIANELCDDPDCKRIKLQEQEQ